jgi:ribonuclease D
MHHTLPPYTYIDDDQQLGKIVPLLLREALVAVDTESNSLHAYRERVCLIQMSTPTQDYILDPLTIGDLSPLGALFADARIEKVFHAGEYDLMCMKRDYGFHFNNLFDTMIAARVCGIKQVGLGNLLTQYVGVTLDKSHQRDDWGARPLPDASLHYAQMDTHYLPTLREHLAARLAELGRETEARESFDELCKVRPNYVTFDPESYWRLAQPHHLNQREAAVLRELYLWREDLAQKRDVPPFKVLSDKSLIALAVKQPDTMNDLLRVDGMGNNNGRRYGHELLRLIERGRKAQMQHPPPPEPPADPFQVEVYTALREWRRDKAAAREVESDVIVPRESLWVIAERMPTTVDELTTIPGLGPWRLAMYGEEMLAVLAKFHKRRR